MNKQITINRRSKVGFAYNSNPTNKPNGGYYYEQPKQPDSKLTGTIKTVLNKIENDNNYQAMRNNTFYSRAWFVKDSGKWYRIIEESGDLLNLVCKLPEGYYLTDSITLECEEV
jgi:hypothetical protein